MKLFTLFALVALLFAAAQASTSKCPCRCTSSSIAAWQCKKSIYSGCKLIPCKTHHRNGLKCCEPPAAPSSTPSAAPSTTSTATPTPTVSMSSTPSATPSPSMSSTPSATPSPSMSMSSTPSATPSPSMSSTPSATPSPSNSSAPSVTPSPSSKPSCPCVCRRGIYGKKAAAKECHGRHGHCKVTTCGYSRFSCCKY